MKIGDLIKQGLAESENNTTSNESDDNAVLVTGYNAMTVDMKYLCSCFAIEAPLRDRIVVIKAQWELSSPRNPIEIDILYNQNPDELKEFGKKHTFGFRDEVLNTDGFDKEMGIGLVRCRGYSQLFAEGGVADQLNSYYGRHASIIIAFLEGKEDFDKIDMSYDDSWGSW
ncbi:hypothetical protein WKH82_08480 [Acinetobacter baumannii]|nr:hypothetical protein [Acinetobacter baumannii]